MLRNYYVLRTQGRLVGVYFRDRLAVGTSQVSRAAPRQSTW